MWQVGLPNDLVNYVLFVSKLKNEITQEVEKLSSCFWCVFCIYTLFHLRKEVITNLIWPNSSIDFNKRSSKISNIKFLIYTYLEIEQAYYCLSETCHIYDNESFTFDFVSFDNHFILVLHCHFILDYTRQDVISIRLWSI